MWGDKRGSCHCILPASCKLLQPHSMHVNNYPNVTQPIKISARKIEIAAAGRHVPSFGHNCHAYIAILIQRSKTTCRRTVFSA